jgi:hypothetical protein
MLLTPNLPNRKPNGPQRDSQHKILHPKKSKLDLLAGSQRNDEFSDITCRLGLANPPNGSDIYVDPTYDPDIGDIIVVKKEKACSELDSIRWALGDKTNAGGPSSEEKEKTGKEKKGKSKGEEKERWWMIGQGRKDSKEPKNKNQSKCRLSRHLVQPLDLLSSCLASLWVVVVC